MVVRLQYRSDFSLARRMVVALSTAIFPSPASRVVNMDRQSSKSMVCWQRGIITLLIPLIERVKYFSGDVRENGKSHAIGVKVTSEMPCDWITSIQHVYSWIFSLQKWSTTTTSFSMQDGILPFTSMAKPRSWLGKELAFLSWLVAHMMT